jgi:DNA-directed RNA polymerase subunit RPC12/RpoP
LTILTEPKSTPAPFQPNPTKWLARFNAIEILGVLLGLAACAMGTIGTIIGVPVILLAIYSAFFIPPKINRGLYIGKCPHCGAEMSATHYQAEVDCPSCARWVAVKDSRFIALEKSGAHKAA